MHIKMLASLAGTDYALAFGDVTDRFAVEEADRLVKAGLAEVAPAPREPVDEAALLGEIEDLKRAVEARDADLASLKAGKSADLTAALAAVETLTASIATKDDEIVALTAGRDGDAGRISELEALLEAATSTPGEDGAGEKAVKAKPSEKRG